MEDWQKRLDAFLSFGEKNKVLSSKFMSFRKGKKRSNVVLSFLQLEMEKKIIICGSKFWIIWKEKKMIECGSKFWKIEKKKIGYGSRFWKISRLRANLHIDKNSKSMVLSWI